MKKIQWATLFLFTFVWQMNGQESFDLASAVQYGLEHNATTKIDQLELVKANAQIREYISIGLPKISGSANLQHFIDIPTSLLPASFTDPTAPPNTFTELQFGLKNNLSAGIDVSTLVFDGSFFTGLKAQKMYRELIIKQANTTDFEIKKNITKAYLSVLITEKNKEQLDKNLKLIQKSLDETKVLFDNGFVEKLDVDRLTLSYDNLNAELDKMARFSDMTENILKFQMSFPLNQEIVLSESLDDMVDLVLTEKIDLEGPIEVSKRPEYETIEITEKLNDININAMRNGYLPSLSAFGSYQASLQRNDLFDNDQPGFLPTTVVGLALNVPIWDGNTRNSQIQMAKVDRELVTVQKQEFERAVTMEVMNARIQYENAKSSVNNAKRSESLANSIYETSQIKFREGVGSSLELTQAESELFSAQSNYINALYELVDAKADLDFAFGNK